MNRRSFTFGALASCVLAAPARAQGYAALTYAPTTWPDIRAQGGRMVLNFRASWSLTCQHKQEIIEALMIEEPAFGALQFVDVDWDTFGPSEWVQRKLKIERRSTLIALRDGKEIARIVNQPNAHFMRKFLRTALDA